MFKTPLFLSPAFLKSFFFLFFAFEKLFTKWINLLNFFRTGRLLLPWSWSWLLTTVDSNFCFAGKKETVDHDNREIRERPQVCLHSPVAVVAVAVAVIAVAVGQIVGVAVVIGGAGLLLVYFLLLLHLRLLLLLFYHVVAIFSVVVEVAARLFFCCCCCCCSNFNATLR